MRPENALCEFIAGELATDLTGWQVLQNRDNEELSLPRAIVTVTGSTDAVLAKIGVFPTTVEVALLTDARDIPSGAADAEEDVETFLAGLQSEASTDVKICGVVMAEKSTTTGDDRIETRISAQVWASLPHPAPEE